MADEDRSVERAIRSTTGPGTRLRTPTGRGEFSIAEVDARGVVLLLGRSEVPVRLPWGCLEGLGRFLDGAGWVRIGSRFETFGDPGTLDEYLKQYTGTATAGWVASLLEHAGVVDIDRGSPLRVRLKTGR